jgi:uncharacterized protein YegP (UPF0339 family)
VTVEILKAKTGWYFRVKARNGRTLCHSEVYRRKASALKTAYLFCWPIRDRS